MQSNSTVNLICLPYAGGNMHSFKELSPLLRKHFNCITLELPGRGSRLLEPLLYDASAIVEDFFQQLIPHLDRDIILYGHSMGGIIANALIHKLKANHYPTPLFFLATGCVAPQFRKEVRQLQWLDDQALKHELKELGGCPEELLASEELMDFLLPIIQADIQALERMEYSFHEKHEVPIHVIVGNQEDINGDRLLGWGLETTAEFTYEQYEGNHFFILDHFDKIADLLHKKYGCIKCSKGKSCKRFIEKRQVSACQS